MSWIASIEFNNFKSYTKQKLDFPPPNSETNIVLIGGENGAGKTSFLEGLYLCLYGKEALTRLARAGVQIDKNVSESYSAFLNAALNKKIATNNRPSKMSIKVKWHYDAINAFEVERIWSFNIKGIYDSQLDNIKFKEICNKNEKPLHSDTLEEYLDAYFLPANQAEFFFFDGEKVRNMLTVGLHSSLMTGVSALLGVDVLMGLKESLKGYKTSKSRKMLPEGKGRIEQQNEHFKKESQIQELAQELTELNKQYDDIKNTLDLQKQRRKSLQNEQAKMGGGSSSVESTKKLVEQLNFKENELKALNTKLNDMLTDKLPFMLMGGHNLCEEIVIQLEAENEKLILDGHKKNEEPRKKLFLDYFLEELDSFEPKLTAKQIKSLDLKATASWERLHYPNNTNLNLDTQIIHVQFGDSEVSRKQTIEAINQDIGLGLSEFYDVYNKKTYGQADLDSLKKQYNNLQSTGNSERHDEIKADLEIADAEISKLDNEEGSLKRAINTKEQDHHNLNASFERVQKQIRDGAGDTHLHDKAHKLLSALDELTQLNQASIYGQKIKLIAEAATEAHHQLSSKNKPYSIDIEPITDRNGSSKVNIFVKNHKGDTVDIVQLSAGEQQILATALLAGLASATSKLVPFVTDTPAGRLDESHRQNLLEFWTNGQQGRQIIILSQNTEITFDVYQSIKNKVSKVFLLRKQLDELGFDETTVLENSYFGVNA